MTWPEAVAEVGGDAADTAIRLAICWLVVRVIQAMRR